MKKSNTIAFALVIIVIFFSGCALPKVDFAEKCDWKDPTEGLEPLPVDLSDNLYNLVEQFHVEYLEMDFDVPVNDLFMKLYEDGNYGVDIDLISSQLSLINVDCLGQLERCAAQYNITVELRKSEKKILLSGTGAGSEYGIGNSVKLSVQNSMADLYMKIKHQIRN